jgi:hypothetical protein
MPGYTVGRADADRPAAESARRAPGKGPGSKEPPIISLPLTVSRLLVRSVQWQLSTKPFIRDGRTT